MAKKTWGLALPEELFIPEPVEKTNEEASVLAAPELNQTVQPEPLDVDTSIPRTTAPVVPEWTPTVLPEAWLALPEELHIPEAPKWQTDAEAFKTFQEQTLKETEPLKVEPIKTEPVKETPLLSAQEIKSNEIANTTAEDNLKTQQNAKATAEFQTALNAWATNQELAKIVNDNPDLRDTFNSLVRDKFKTNSNIQFVGKYSWFDNKQLDAAVKSGAIVVWSEQYNLLSPEQKASFAQFQKESNALTSKAEDTAQFNVDNNKTISLNDIVTQVSKLFSSDLREKSQELLNTEEINEKAEQLEAKQNEIDKVNDKLDEDRLRKRIIKQYPGYPAWFINSKIADEKRDLIREKNSLINEYNSGLGTYKSLKDNAQAEIDLLKYEDTANKAIYNTALNLYETRRSEMTDAQAAKFKAENDKIAAEQKLEDDKSLIEFKAKIDAGEWEYKTINDKLFFVEWDVATLVVDAWDEIWAYNDKDWKITTYKNDNGTFSSVFTNIKTQQVYQKTTDADWIQTWSYLENLWLWTVTWYGWDYDSGLWLDIDWAMGQPFTAPMWGNVINAGKDKAYWNYIDIQLDDWNFVRYSHLQDTFLQKWDKFSMKDNLWTIWNTWNVRALDPTNPEWRVPTANELARWVWSHLDIVTQTPNGLYRTSQQSEQYLAWLWKWTILDKETFNIQTEILDRFEKDAEVKTFKEAFAQNKNLISSLWSKGWAWDMAAIFQFMKALDPRSVVRESEFDLAGWTSGTISKYITKSEWIITWVKLPESARKEFEELAMQYIKNRWALYDEAYNRNKILYEQQGLPLSAYPNRLTDEINSILNANLELSSWKTFNQQDYEENKGAPIW